MLKQLDENNRYYYIVELASKEDGWIPVDERISTSIPFKKYDIINGMLVYATPQDIERYRKAREKQRG